MAWIEMDSIESATNAIAFLHNTNLYTIVFLRLLFYYSRVNYYVYRMQHMEINKTLTCFFLNKQITNSTKKQNELIKLYLIHSRHAF